MYKMLNLSLKELRLIAKNRNTNVYKSIPKDKLLRIINNNKRDRKSLFKSKIEEVRKILHDSKIDGNRQIEEINKIPYDPRNKLFKLEKDHYKPVNIDDDFSRNYVEYKINGDKDKTLMIKDHLDEIKPYLSGIINDHKTQGEWKVQLVIAIKFFSSKDSEEIRTSDNLEIMIDNETDEIIEHLFDSFLQRYQKTLEESLRGSKFVFDSVDSLYNKLHKKKSI